MSSGGAASELKRRDSLIVVCHVVVFTCGPGQARPGGPQTRDKAASVGYVTPGTQNEMTRPLWNADTDI